MKNYKFILKPLFFLFNLVFATWLVFAIEKISPSDFGQYKHLFDTQKDPMQIDRENKIHLMKLLQDFKNGALDSADVAGRLEHFLVLPANSRPKKGH
jgi:hypothetical protein